MDWMHGWRLVGVSLALITLGCGAAPVDPTDGSSEGGSDSSGDGSIDGASESSADGSTTSPVEEGPNCASADASLTLEVSGTPAHGDCVVVAPVGAQSLRYECEDFDVGTYTGGITISATPPIVFDVPVGTAITIDGMTTDSEWEQEPRESYFVRDAATNHLLVATIDAHDDEWTGELFPVSFTPIEGACSSQPDENDCLTEERRMWNAQYAETTELVGDGTRAQVGAYTVHIQRASDGNFLECVDVETDFYQAVIVRTE